MPAFKRPFFIREQKTKESDDKDKSNTSRRITDKLDKLDKKMDGLYKDVYLSRPDNKHNLISTFNSLDDVIDKIQDNEMSVSGMSELLRRINFRKDSTSVDTYMTSVQDIFNDPNIMDILFVNNSHRKFIIEQNYQYDMICRYLPKLVDALELKRDNVLCSDNFAKKFINPKSTKSSKKEIEKFVSNCDRLEERFDLSEFFDKTYMNISKYGEEFLYVVPYKAAFARIFNNAKRRRSNQSYGFGTSFFSEAKEIDLTPNTDEERLIGEQGFSDKFLDDINLKISFNDSGIINSTIDDIAVLENTKQLNKFTSLCESAKGLTNAEAVNKMNSKLTNAADGLTVPVELRRDENKLDKDFIGTVIERLPRENVIPVYIGKKCFGYYYLEVEDAEGECAYCGQRHNGTLGLSSQFNMDKDLSEQQEEFILRFIANRISQNIDTHFINVNKDLKDEIYNVLLYNEKFDISRTNNLSVTFIPAEDIVHCYNEFDEDTHRGISDLQKAVVPAMLYILLYLTDIIGKITRSTDKRIYYVKQNVETNVARTMMNVVKQIKKGNMGMRQIESMNSILNVVGKYNDYVIPMGQSGDPPITFEVMQGQDINTPTEIMDKMEESAVNTICPYEMVNSSYQQDFAIRFSMSNTKFLKSLYTRQRKTERWMTPVFTKAYNYEFDDDYVQIKIELPPPVYLTMTNNQQLLDNITQMADKIVELKLANEDEEVKTEFKNIYIQDALANYLDYNRIDRQIDRAKVNVEVNKLPAADESSGGTEDYSSY